MRRFATWTTGHKKTVIFGWIAALIVIVGIAGTVGSDFSEEFKLPTSDSTEAYELLEDNFPQQSGGTSQIVYKAEKGVNAPQVKEKMETVFKSVEKEPNVTEVASPYKGGGASGISKDGKIAYATIQYDVQTNELDKASTKRIIKIAQGASEGSALNVQLGGQAITEAEEESGDSSFGIGLLAAILILLLAFGSVVAMGLPIITALFALGVGLSLVTIGTHVVDTANFAPVLAAMIGLGVGIDYALFIITRFREDYLESGDAERSVVAAMDTAGRAILLAG
ncbi:MAG TPA: MMPL family transporter, partial [Solirubrobacterales bacterium]